MGNVTVEMVLQTVQNHLNDYGQTFYEANSLINFLQEAYQELGLELELNGISTIKTKSAVITIPAIANMSTWPGYVNLPTQPIDIVEPIECWERPTGDTLESDWDLMIQKSWVPECDPVQELIYWTWNRELIQFVGALQSNDIKLYYNGSLTPLTAEGDTLQVVNGEMYIAPRGAALAARAIGAKAAYKELTDLANARLDKILGTKINAEQALPVRRRPYRHGRRPFVIR